jgi:hypothetical protein
MAFLQDEVIISSRTANELELTRWCYDHFGSSESGTRWRVYSTVWFSDDEYNNTVVHVAAFACEEDAMQCKLTWL